MKYFFDNNISIRIANAINELEGRDGNTVTHLRTKFSQSATDIEWMKKLGQEGSWVVITSDRNIIKNPLERRAWLESGLTVFFLKENFKNHPFWDQAWQLIRRWEGIRKEAEKNPSSALFVFNLTGLKIERIN